MPSTPLPSPLPTFCTQTPRDTYTTTTTTTRYSQYPNGTRLRYIQIHALTLTPVGRETYHNITYTVHNKDTHTHTKQRWTLSSPVPLRFNTFPYMPIKTKYIDRSNDKQIQTHTHTQSMYIHTQYQRRCGLMVNLSVVFLFFIPPNPSVCAGQCHVRAEEQEKMRDYVATGNFGKLTSLPSQNRRSHASTPIRVIRRHQQYIGMHTHTHTHTHKSIITHSSNIAYNHALYTLNPSPCPLQRPLLPVVVCCNRLLCATTTTTRRCGRCHCPFHPKSFHVSCQQGLLHHHQHNNMTVHPTLFIRPAMTIW